MGLCRPRRGSVLERGVFCRRRRGRFAHLERPGADAAKGRWPIESDGRFCWDFADKDKGLYHFWADVPDASCSALICPRDGFDGNGAMYMTAPKATVAARKWLHCEPTGCDGVAYWDGAAFTPMGD